MDCLLYLFPVSVRYRGEKSKFEMCCFASARSVQNREEAEDSGQFIGRPQTFVELQLRFKLHFYTKKMQFEM